MASWANVLQQWAGVFLAVSQHCAGLGLDIPGTVRILQANTVPAAADTGAPTAGQGEPLHLVLTQHHHAAGVGLHEDVGHGDVEGEELDLFNEIGSFLPANNLRDEFEDPAPGGPNKHHVHHWAGVRHQGRVHRYAGQSLVGAGLDEVWRPTVWGNTPVHQNIFFQKV